jgi:NTF2 fold immunity protein
MRLRSVIVSLGLLVVALVMIYAQSGAGVPEKGFVPDEVTAIRIAEAVLAAIYGDWKIAAERPYHAVLTGGLWSVEGTLHTALGGVALVRLRRQDGAIISVSHGK